MLVSVLIVVDVVTDVEVTVVVVGVPVTVTVAVAMLVSPGLVRLWDELTGIPWVGTTVVIAAGGARLRKLVRIHQGIVWAGLGIWCIP